MLNETVAGVLSDLSLEWSISGRVIVSVVVQLTFSSLRTFQCLTIAIDASLFSQSVRNPLSEIRLA